MSKEFIRIVCFILIGAAIYYFFIPNELNKNYGCEGAGKLSHRAGPGIEGTQCCGWLKQKPTKDEFDKNCKRLPLSGGGNGICLSCGDGRCDTKYESKCNCPEDCK